MLSRTRGLGKHSGVLGTRRDTQSLQTTMCPILRKLGKCRQNERERVVREQIAREKEAELRRKALALYSTQVELLAELAEEGGSDEEDPEAAKLRELLLGTSSGSGSKAPAHAVKAEAVARLVAELKGEPDYVHWSLEAAVAERLVELKVRHCRYSHRTDALQSLKRARNITAQEGASLLKQERAEEAAGVQVGVGVGATAVTTVAHSSSSAAVATEADTARAERVRAEFAAERARVFSNMTPLQRCVVALMWQRHFKIPQLVLCPNVRRRVEEAAEAERPGPDNEETLDAYLDSAEFEQRVAAAEAATVEHVAFRPSFGVLDLTAITQVVAHISRNNKGNNHNRCSPGDSAPPFIVSAETMAFFGSTPRHLFAVGKGGPDGLGHPVTLTEKELDLSAPERAVELIEAVEWALSVYNSERRLRPDKNHEDDDDDGEKVGGDKASARLRAAYMRLSHRAGRVVLRSLSLRNSQITLADGLVASLRKAGFDQSLLALDLSDNRLHSLRFLFALRAHFGERLLRLSLRNNLITRKPEYQEQVRKSLPRLTSLDGEPIRRPPLLFPKAAAASYTALSLVPGGKHAGPPQQQGGAKDTQQVKKDRRLSQEEYDLVMDTIARLLYIWETRRIPHTELERKSFLKEAGATARGRFTSDNDSVNGNISDNTGNSKSDDDEEAALMPPEEDINDDNFPHRYLHPSATFTLTMAPGLTLFDGTTMKLDREVEFDDGFTGLRLNAHDIKDARVFDVAVKNSSRNLLVGRTALQRFGRGCDNCYLAYLYTVYPERIEVDHGLAGAVVTVVKMPQLPTTTTTTTASINATAVKKGFGTAAAAPGARPLASYLVTIHGVMTWRLPSMRGGQCFSAAYDRTLVLSERLIAAQNYTWERRRSPKLILCNDHLLLRPVVATTVSGPRGLTVFSPATAARLARLVVQFGLEACRQGEGFVRAVMERTASDAAEEAALDALVFGPVPAASGGEEEEPAHVAAANAAVRGAFECVLGSAEPTASSGKQEKKRRGAAAAVAEDDGTGFFIFSLLDRAQPAVAVAVAAAAEVGKWGGSTLHAVPLALLDAVAAATNAHYSLEALHQRP